MSKLLENLKKILEEKNNKIKPENIKSGVTIFNVEGSLENDYSDTMSPEEYLECEALANVILFDDEDGAPPPNTEVPGGSTNGGGNPPTPPDPNNTDLPDED